MCTLTNNEDSYEMLHYAAFHLGLHCLVRQNNILRNKYIVMIACDLSLYTMDDPKCIVNNPLVRTGLKLSNGYSYSPTALF